MKKIKKHSLKSLKENCILLDDSTQMSILGGVDVLKINGGTLEEINGGVQYTGDDGSSCYFEGVTISTCFVREGTAYQLFGCIHISEDWINGGFSVKNFAHEYGHYLQEKEMGIFDYIVDVAYPSAYNMWFEDGYNHNELECEIDADRRAQEYLQSHWIEPSDDNDNNNE